MRWFIRLAAAIGLATLLLLSLLGVTVLGTETVRTATVHGGLPDVELEPLAQRSEILAADGSLLSALFEEDRVSVPLDQVPPVLVDAVIAVEDSSFYEHRGVSVRGLVRAAKENATSGEVEEGGSTITQQLVKNSLLTPDRSYDRKAKELVLAIRMERELSKDEILQRYLNTVYFGQSTYGVRAASERYFGKPLDRLALPEAALLAGLIASPESFDPFSDPDAARARRAHVLRRMTAEGAITAEDAAAAGAAPLPTAPHGIDPAPLGYFVEEVKRQLLRDERLGRSQQARYDALFRGGLTIRTTLDPATQRAAERAVAAQLPPSAFSAALVAIDPRSGGVRALVGGPGLDKLRFNLATQGGRQAGSTFKVVTLAAALEAGHSPEDLVDGTAPCTLPLPRQEPWTVDNYEEGSGGVTTLREATVKSLNCAFARTALAIGPGRIAAMAERLGVGRKLSAVPSITLGTHEVSPLEMATVFATLAADGVRTDPYLVSEVTDASGKVLLRADPNRRQVIEPEIARTVTSVLEGVITSGTGQAAAIGRPAAGKTGTSQEWRDAWFAGYTPALATAVWMGSPEGQVSMIGVGGRNVTGGSYPAKIWAAFMGWALGGTPAAGFTPPDPSRWPAPQAIGELPPGFVLPGAAPPPPPAETPSGDSSPSGGSGGSSGDGGGGGKGRKGKGG